MDMVLWMGAAAVAQAADCPDPASLVLRAEEDAVALYLADAMLEVNDAVRAMACGPLADPTTLGRLYRTRGWVAHLMDDVDQAEMFFAAAQRMAPGTWTETFEDDGAQRLFAQASDEGTATLKVDGLVTGEVAAVDGWDAMPSVSAGAHVVQAGRLPDTSRFAQVVTLQAGETSVIDARDGTVPEPEVVDAPRIAARTPTLLRQTGSPFTVGVDTGLSIHDTFLRRVLGQLSVGWFPSPHAGLELTGAVSPDLGEADWANAFASLVSDFRLTASLSRVLTMGALDVVVTPLWSRARVFDRPRPFGVFLRAGAAVVYTEDDPFVAQVDPEVDVAFAETWKQVHLAPQVGLGASFHVSRRTALRAQWRTVFVVEDYRRVPLDRRYAFFSVGVHHFAGGVR